MRTAGKKTLKSDRTNVSGSLLMVGQRSSGCGAARFPGQPRPRTLEEIDDVAGHAVGAVPEQEPEVAAGVGHEAPEVVDDVLLPDLVSAAAEGEPHLHERLSDAGGHRAADDLAARGQRELVSLAGRQAAGPVEQSVLIHRAEGVDEGAGIQNLRARIAKTLVGRLGLAAPLPGDDAAHLGVDVVADALGDARSLVGGVAALLGMVQGLNGTFLILT